MTRKGNRQRKRSKTQYRLELLINHGNGTICKPSADSTDTFGVHDVDIKDLTNLDGGFMTAIFKQYRVVKARLEFTPTRINFGSDQDRTGVILLKQESLDSTPPSTADNAIEQLPPDGIMFPANESKALKLVPNEPGVWYSINDAAAGNGRILFRFWWGIIDTSLAGNSPGFFKTRLTLAFR